MNKSLCIIAIIAAIGAINWGLVGLFKWDIIAAVFGTMSEISRTIYILVGIAGIALLFLLKPLINPKKVVIDHDVAAKQTILSTSPEKSEQEKFIAEGGNSQPLTKEVTDQ